MIKKETYKRLTLHKITSAYDYERENLSKEMQANIYDRLSKLEDKIESGQLVEFPFAVIDKQTKREADEYKISIKEDWAKDLCYCDMDGFAITQDGNLILLDECGKYTYCPCDRFEIIDKTRLKELQEDKK